MSLLVQLQEKIRAFQWKTLPAEGTEKRKDITQSAVTNTLESSEMMVSKKVRNFGAPPEESGIAIVTEIRSLSDTVPECVESTENPGVWFYNRPAFDWLVKMWVLPFLSEEQLLAHINAIPGDSEAKAQIMNGEDELFPGYFLANWKHGKLCDHGKCAGWWVVSSNGPARSVFLSYEGKDALSHSCDLGDGYLVPVFSDEN